MEDDNAVDKKIVAKKVAVEKKVSITFKENRKFDLHIGRQMLTFRGRETKSVSSDWLNHPDFKQVSKYFIVKGV